MKTQIQKKKRKNKSPLKASGEVGLEAHKETMYIVIFMSTME